MVLAVRANRMPGAVDSANRRGVGARHAAHHEERRLHAHTGQRIQHAVGVRQQGTVVEGQDDLAIPKRQRLPILHPAEPGKIRVRDCQLSADTQRIGVSRTGGLSNSDTAHKTPTRYQSGGLASPNPQMANHLRQHSHARGTGTQRCGKPRGCEQISESGQGGQIAQEPCTVRRRSWLPSVGQYRYRRSAGLS